MYVIMFSGWGDKCIGEPSSLRKKSYFTFNPQYAIFVVIKHINVRKQENKIKSQPFFLFKITR